MKEIAKFFEVSQAIIEKIVPSLLMCFCAILLIMAVVFTLREQIAISAALMGIFIVSLLVIVLPRLRVLEAFGIKAELAEEIEKAEVTIDQMKSLTRASAKQGFHQASLHSTPLAAKKELLAILNEVLEAAKLSDIEAADLRRPFFDSLARDLFYLGHLVTNHLHCEAIKEAETRLQTLALPIQGIDDPQARKREELQSKKDRLSTLKIPKGSFVSATPNNLSIQLDRCYDSEFPRSDDDNRRLRNILDHARRIMAECVACNNITPDFEAFVAFKPMHIAGYAAANDLGERAKNLLHSRFGES